jgi:hypothetical protein
MTLSCAADSIADYVISNSTGTSTDIASLAAAGGFGEVGAHPHGADGASVPYGRATPGASIGIPATSVGACLTQCGCAASARITAFNPSIDRGPDVSVELSLRWQRQRSGDHTHMRPLLLLGGSGPAHRDRERANHLLAGVGYDRRQLAAYTQRQPTTIQTHTPNGPQSGRPRRACRPRPMAYYRPALFPCPSGLSTRHVR